jgi:hypothetical protein
MERGTLSFREFRLDQDILKLEVALLVGLDSATLCLGVKLAIVGGFAGKNVGQPVEKQLALIVGGEAVADHAVVIGELFRALLHVLAIERAAVDQTLSGLSIQASERLCQANPPESMRQIRPSFTPLSPPAQSPCRTSDHLLGRPGGSYV